MKTIVENELPYCTKAELQRGVAEFLRINGSFYGFLIEQDFKVAAIAEGVRCLEFVAAGVVFRIVGRKRSDGSSVLSLLAFSEDLLEKPGDHVAAILAAWEMPAGMVQ